MKILLLGKPESEHIIKWACGIANNGIEVGIFSLNPFEKRTVLNDNKNIQIFYYHIEFSKKKTLKKIKYINSLFFLKRLLKDFKPDIIHSHYLSSYGILGALSGFHPFIVSVWGDDIFNFPKRNVVFKLLTKFTLKRADRILSTSKIMAKETAKYTKKDIIVTPFGVDLRKFDVFNVDRINFNEDDIIIGTVKTLEKKYGIDILIKAFKMLIEKYHNLPLKLILIGGGNDRLELEELSANLGISDVVEFIGKIDMNEVPKYLNLMDIYCAFSIDDSESFGVAIIEASACQKPVVVSDVGGLPEVVENGKTGIVVERNNIEDAFMGIEKLLLDEKERIRMGINGRKKVISEYDFKLNLEQVINIYKELI